MAYHSLFASPDDAEFSLSPIEDIKVHTIEKSREIGDTFKIFVMLEFFDECYRGVYDYSYSVEGGSHYILRLLQTGFLNSSLENVSDLSEIREHRRHLANITTFYNVTRVRDLFFSFFLLVVYFFFLNFFFKSFNIFIKLNSFNLYNPEAI